MIIPNILPVFCSEWWGWLKPAWCPLWWDSACVMSKQTSLQVVPDWREGCFCGRETKTIVWGLQCFILLFDNYSFPWAASSLWNNQAEHTDLDETRELTFLHVTSVHLCMRQWLLSELISQGMLSESVTSRSDSMYPLHFCTQLLTTVKN